MKTSLLFAVLLAAAVPAVTAQEAKSEKTLGQKTADALEKAGEKTKEAGKALMDSTKKTAEAVKDAVTPADARRVEVRLIDHKIEMPQQLAAGKTAFIVTNGGSAKHNFEIEGQGMEKKFLTDVGPNETKTLHVDLKPGSYKVYCPVGDHEEHGMKMDLTVK
ncbi:cupredoxin domain-containing protein [Roseimicrobium sp. ORNL1]|uniref:cupredoxin domain-containing protein n=1 Tax=Roseimicrobium sp. ORNL1 TaxID=2711231 RepID=UPI0013E1BF9F|nr:cupredoxin domain-containing protein [Roseimicrobium sp. ORNL1]QIF02363.1 hypothetical protein G5S37_12800 [Roseimicrobium sp. ORNL1]